VSVLIKSSPLWPLCEVFRLTIPIRNVEDPSFADFIDAIGDGAGPEIPLYMFSTVYSSDKLLDFVYPIDVLSCPGECLKRVILAPANDQVDEYNRMILQHVVGEERFYYASDSLQETDEAG